MKFKALTEDQELETYRHAIAGHIDVLFPLEYLKQGRVFGYYNERNEICGGFALIMSGPFRVLESIPNFKGFKIDPSLEDTAELTGVWLSQKDKKQFDSFKFWINVITQIALSRKKYFVYAYSTKKEGLGKLYSHANPKVLFRGDTKILPGMPSPDNESVEVILRRRVLRQIIKNPDFFIKRLLKTNKKQNKKDFYETEESPIMSTISSLVELWPRESEINS